MKKVIILSGAGISAESGIQTFRDSDGLWENHKLEDVCSRGCLEKNRKATLAFYDQRRVELKDKQPNHAHKKKNLYEELNSCDLLVVIGTSGLVLDVNAMAKARKRSILNNYEPSEHIDDTLFTKVIYGKATLAIDEIADMIEKVLEESSDE